MVKIFRICDCLPIALFRYFSRKFYAENCRKRCVTEYVVASEGVMKYFKNIVTLRDWGLPKVDKFGFRDNPAPSTLTVLNVFRRDMLPNSKLSCCSPLSLILEIGELLPH